MLYDADTRTGNTPPSKSQEVSPVSIFEKLFHTNNISSTENENLTAANIEKVTALINAFATGDTAAARRLVQSEWQILI